jgi:hypothetical protein
MAIDADDDETLSGFRSYAQQPMTRRLTPEQQNAGTYSWIWRPDRVQELVDLGREQRLFLCGNAANAPDFYSSFSKVFALIVTQEQLSRQLGARTTGFGSTETDRQKIYGWNQSFNDAQHLLGAQLVRTDRAPALLADFILGQCDDAE